MRCTDHDRDHCPEPRCHVLAVCAVAASERPWRWLQVMGYEHLGNGPLVERQIATRLVAWMRWDGSLPCEWSPRHGPHTPSSCRVCYGGFAGHPLDAVISHVDRVKALASKCQYPRCEVGPLGKRHHIEEVISEKASRVSWCDHDGINWGAVVTLLDQMEERGISLDVVHKWRAPSLEGTRFTLGPPTVLENGWAAGPEDFGGEDFPTFTSSDD